MRRIPKDDIKTLVVVVLVCVISIGLIILLNTKSNSEKLEAVNEYNNFFSVNNYINNYINNISKNNSELVYNLLDQKYLEKNNITKDNIFDNINNYPSNSSINISNMEYVKIKNNYLYYIEGKIYQNTFDSQNIIDDNFKIIVMIDFNNQTYSIYPLEDNYKKIIDNIKKITIEKNNDNNISKSDLVTKEQVCIIYLSDFINKINTDINSSYDLLSDNMKKEYTLDTYKTYISNNLNKITTLADKCYLDKKEEQRIYSVIDKNGNKFTFKENKIMNYTVDIYLNED